MLAILPLCLLLLLYVIFNCKNSCWRSSLLSAFIVWGIGLTVMTELLSLGKLLTFDWLVWSWISIDLATGYRCFILIKNRKPTVNREIPSNRSPFSILLLCGIALIIGIVGLVAVVSPPNNWDSMVYHMSRVVHWEQNHSLAYYPVSALRQLYQSPWAEFAILHLQILSGGDRFANLVQWFSMVGSIVGVSLIAKQIGANERGQIFAAVVCATIPMGILQGSSTQNDYVVSFWLVCFVYYVLLIANNRWSPIDSIVIGGSLGLALLTKGTAYIYALPFCVWLAIALSKQKPNKLSKHVFTIASLVLLLNISQAMRNLNLFGSPIAMGEEKYTNDFFSISVFLSNIIRNISLHLLAILV
jgi:Dolichyl-phosphate-mannose-protein mannosyltransferase